MDTKSVAPLKGGRSPGRPPDMVRIEITRRTVAAHSPRDVGEVLELPAREAKMLIAIRKAKLAAARVHESKPDKK